MTRYIPNVQPASAPTPLDLKVAFALLHAAVQLSLVLLVCQHEPLAP
jgi:hypothetical protein